MRKTLSIGLCVLGAVTTALSLFGMWHHVTIGPLYGPGLELGVGALAVSAVCFVGSYWYAG